MYKQNVFAVIAAAALVSVAAMAEPYTRLFRIMNPNGDCQIKKAGSEIFEPAGKGKAYPFGSEVQCGLASSAIILFSDADAVRVLPEAAVSITLEGESRVVNLNKGTIVTRIGANTTNDAVVIDTPLGRCRSIIGNCKINLYDVPATKHAPAYRNVEMRAEPMSQMKFVGDQFIVPVLKNGFGVRITSTTDNSYTLITDLLGDYQVYVNSGTDPDPEGPVDENQDIQPIKMSAKSALKIWREKAPVGGRTIVSVFATTPSGKGRESFAFAVGNANIASRSNVFFDPMASNEVSAASSSYETATESNGDGGFENEVDAGVDDGETESDASTEAPAAKPTSDDEGLYDFLY